MLKTFGLLVRRPDLTERRFHEHWAGPHRELAVKISNIRRYVQFHVDGNRSVPGFPATDIDGIPELWWDDMDAVRSLRHNPEYTENAMLDEPNFMDVDRHGRMITHEHVRMSSPDFAAGRLRCKGMLLLTKTDDASDEDLDTWAAATWAPRVATLPGLRRHVDAFAVRGASVPPSAFDLMTELWFANAQELDAAAPALQTLAASLDDDAPLSLGRSASVVGSELRVIWPDA